MSGLGIIIALYFYIRLAIWVVRKLVGERESKPLKWSIRVTVVIMFALIPTWDTILGHIYLNHLCNTEAGVKVYQTVELPAEYWDGQGRMQFLKSNGDIDQVLLGKKFEWHSVSEPYSTSLVKVDKQHWQFRDGKTQNILAERTSFWWHGGWLEDFSPAPTKGASCPLLSEQYSGNEYIQRQYEQEQNFYSKIFKPINPK